MIGKAQSHAKKESCGLKKSKKFLRAGCMQMKIQTDEKMNICLICTRFFVCKSIDKASCLFDFEMI